MKFKKSGRMFLALVVSLGVGFGLTSCANDYTVAYLYVTGSYQNQIGAFKIANNTGNLSAIPGSPFGSGGTDPVRAIVSATGRYLYVLNAGKATTDPTTGNTTYSSANITVYSIGGNGTLAPQQSYTSQGFGSIRFAFNTGGSFLYVLDEYSPAAGGMTGATTQVAGMSCRDSAGIFHPTGDITAFSVDTNTGRLSLVTNSQVQGANGTQLPYFPVGCQPIDLKVTGANVLVADTMDPVTLNKYTVFPYAESLTTGQLTVTQNTEFVTGAASISVIGSDAATKYIYILDPVSDSIWYYTIGANGLLQAVNGSPTKNTSNAGNPTALTSDSKSQFLLVANDGPPSTSVTEPNSDISVFNIAANGVLANVSGSPFGTGSGPQCIIEDPSNQYIYTADFNSNTVSGHVIDPNTGVLTPLRNQSTYPTVGQPTWCVADGHTD